MAKQSCLVCGSNNTQKCSGCKTASYCNKEHQKQDWRAHKEYCHKVRAAGDKTFDAILFPVNERKPRLVKVPWETSRVSEDDIEFTKLDMDVWYKHPNKAVRPIFFDKLGINGPDLGRGLCFMFDDNFGNNNLPLNQCIVNITGGKAGHHWCGNILGLRMNGYDDYQSAVIEEDLKLFVTYFDEYNKVTPNSYW